MKATNSISQNILSFGIPMCLIAMIVVFVQTPWFQLYPKELSIGFTLDLAFTVPLVYFLLIRKRKIPNTTVIPFFIAGILIAGLIIPDDHQFYLSQIKLWVLPLVELGALTFLLLKIRKMLQVYKARQGVNPDFYTTLRQAAQETLPSVAAAALSTEIAMVYYGLFNWKKRKLAAHEFSYHKESGSIALLGALIFIILVETIVLHILLHLLWSVVWAWVLTGLSLYTALQIFALIRSMSQRPVAIENGKLELRYGIFSEASLLLENIDQVEISSKSIEDNDKVCSLSPLGEMESHNIVVHLKEQSSLRKLYGMKKSFKSIAFYVDEKESFVQELHNKMASGN